MTSKKIYSVIVWSSDDTPYGYRNVLFLTDEKKNAETFCKEYVERHKEWTRPLLAVYIVEQELDHVFKSQPDAKECVWANY